MQGGEGRQDERQSSNRTFMELKLYNARLLERRKNCSNRTFMELKYRTDYCSNAHEVF